MKFFCNGQPVGSPEHLEWKEESNGGTVTFMAPFDFDWSDHTDDYLELKDDDGSTRVMLSTIKQVDEGSTGSFVVATYKPL